MNLKCTDNIFYNYIYCDPRKMGYYKVKNIDLILPAEPFYVGRGKANRKLDHIKEALQGINNCHYKNKIINEIIEIGLQPIIVQINNNLSNLVANENERYLVKAIGRADLHKGPLSNLTDGGDTSYGYKMDQKAKDNAKRTRESKTEIQKQASRKKISDALKGREVWNSIEVCKVNPITLEVLARYKSICKAAQENNIKVPSKIQLVCEGERNSCGKFLWFFAKDIDNGSAPIKENSEKFYIKYVLKKHPGKNKKIVQFDKDKNFITIWNSVTEANISLNKSSSAINNCCKINGNGLKATSAGFYWIDYLNYKNIYGEV